MNAHVIPEKGDESKAERRPYFPFYGDDWSGGTIGFTLEQEGFYLRLVKCQWARRGDLPDDINWLSAALHCDVRKVRRLRQFLIDAGKIRSENGMLFNPRMRLLIAEDEAKIEQRSARDRRKIGAISRGSTPKKPTRSALGHRQPKAEADPEPKREDPVSSVASVARPAPAAAPDKIDLNDLKQKLYEAANGSLVDEASHPGIAVLHIPQMWLREGCDLELDVLPTIREIGARKHGSKIRDWKYFTSAVAEAKATREAGLPAVEPGRLKQTANEIAMKELMRDLIAPVMAGYQ